MIAPSISLAVLACPLILSTSLAPAPSASDVLTPPGMVLISGGMTKVGTPLKEMKKLLEENPQLQKNSGGFLAEVPEHNVDVADFFYMVTEVTNEQYREFVKSAKARPPIAWGKEPIDAARSTFLNEEGEKRQKAKEEGRDPGPRQTFDEVQWWSDNWKDAEWKMPADLALKPVVYVDYQDARKYAEWAGLRIPDENEFERAARGKTTRIYPWGDDFEAGKQAATVEIRGVSDVFEVGNFPDGSTENGVMDLAGNVWEWTTSRYVAYPRWKHKSFTVGKGKRKKTIDTPPAFSPDRRVVKGGSMQNSHFYARLTTRGGFDRFQTASALGFRCAASTKQGFDFAVTREDEIPNQIRPQTEDGPIEYDPNAVIAMDRWVTTETDCKVPGYAVIKGYDFILFTPATAITTTGVADFAKAAKKDMAYHVGFLATSQDVVEPALPAGTYLVALRGKGKPAQKKDEGEAEEGAEVPAEGPSTDGGNLTELLAFDTSVDNFIFFDMTGAPVAASPVEKLNYVNPSTSSLAVVDKTIMIPNGEDEEIPLVQKWLDIDLFVKGKSRKGVKTILSLRFEDGVLEGNWR
jgi:formylglycine-generating enzyme required for sulfatase activity